MTAEEGSSVGLFGRNVDAVWVLAYLDGRDLAVATGLCSALRSIAHADQLWFALCEHHGFKQRCATRTRGVKPWRTVFELHLCVECLSPGRVVIDVNAHSRLGPQLHALCDACYTSTLKAGSMAARRSLTQRVAQRHGEIVRTKLIAAIPAFKCARKRKRAQGSNAAGAGAGAGAAEAAADAADTAPA